MTVLLQDETQSSYFSFKENPEAGKNFQIFERVEKYVKGSSFREQQKDIAIT
jgi:hypothetical protein